MTMIRSAFGVLVLLNLGFLLVACGDDEPGGSKGRGKPKEPEFSTPVIQAPDQAVAGTVGLTAHIETPEDGISYTWEIDGGDITSDAEGASIAFDVGEGPFLSLTVVASDEKGRSESATHSIDVLPQQEVAITAPTHVTEGREGIAASVSPVDGATYEWSIQGGSLQNGQGTHSITFSARGPNAVNLSIRIVDVEGVPSQGAMTISVVPPPNAKMQAPQVVTLDKRVKASVPPQPGSTFTWTISGGLITSGAGTEEITFNGGAGESLTLGVTVANAAGDSDYSEREIRIVAPASVTIAAPETVTAEKPGYTASVPPQDESTFVWSITNGTLLDGQGTEEITFVAHEPGPLTLEVEVTNAAGDAEIGEATVVVVTLPDPTISLDSGPFTEETSGHVASVLEVEGSTYQWEVTGGTIEGGQGTAGLTFTAGSPGELVVSVSVTNAAGDEVSDSVSRTVVARPNATILAPEVVTSGREGLSASVPAQEGSSFAWTISGGVLTGGEETEAVSFSAGDGASLTLAVTVTNAAGDSASDEVEIRVVPAPVAAIAGEEGPVTEGAKGLEASVTHQPNSTYAWSITNGTITAGQGTHSILFEAGTPGPIEFTVSVTNEAGDSAMDVKIIEAVPAPIATISTVATVTTGAEGIVATVPEQSGSTLLWSVVNGTITGGQGTSSIQLTAGGVGVMEISATVTNAAGSTDTQMAEIQVVAAPDATITAASIVTADKAGLSASVPAQLGSTYEWSVTNGTITDGQGSETITFTAGAPGNLVLEVVVTNPANDAAPGETTIEVISPPEATVSAPSGPVSEGTFGLVASVPSQQGSTYQWTVSGGALVSGQGTSSIEFETPNVGDVEVSCVVTNAAGDELSGSAWVQVVALPDATITAPEKVLRWQKDVVASVPLQAGSTYAWTITNGTITSPADGHEITFTVEGGDTVTLEVEVTNAAGDSDSEWAEHPLSWGYSTLVGDMITPRINAKAVTLQDGRVLITGGRPSTSSQALRSAEIFSPETNTFTAAESMEDMRTDHTMTLLQDGRVLVTGGRQASGNVVYASCEIFDPTTGTWTTAKPMITLRYLHSATLLDDGRVLVVGGRDWNDYPLLVGEIYDPSSDQWVPMASATSYERIDHQAILLSSGNVFVTGNLLYYPEYVGEVFNSTTSLWTKTSSVLGDGDPLPKYTSPLSMPNGLVLLTGGIQNPDYPNLGYETLSAMRIYNPDTNLYTADYTLPPMKAPRARHASYLLPNGWVLLAGGVLVDPGGTHTGSRTVDLIDPSTYTSYVGEDLLVGRVGAATALLSGGRMLVFGGREGSSALGSAEVYHAAH